MNRYAPRRYDIEADWIINDFCNYSCDYCFYHSKKEHALTGKISPESYLHFFNKTGKTWLFHFSGGEPLFYPDFVNLCRVLSNQHLIALNSNLSTAIVLEVANVVAADRIEYIHCGLHPIQRERHEGYDLLMARIRMLIDKGIPVFASCVMTPSVFDFFNPLQERFAGMGVPLIPKVLRGMYKKAPYPESYTNTQRDNIIKFSNRAQVIADQSNHQALRHHPTINPLVDKYFLEGFPDFSGVLCSAGKDFVRIKPDGNIYRCGSSTIIGSIFKGEMKLYQHRMPCNDSCCPYICLRYSELDLATARERPKRFQIR